MIKNVHDFAGKPVKRLLMLLLLWLLFGFVEKQLAFATDLTINGSGAYSYEGGTDFSVTVNDGTYTITMAKNVTSTTSDNIVVASDVTATVILNGVNIDVSGTSDACAFELQSGADVTLDIEGKNTLKSGSKKAGLQVPSGTAIAIVGDGSIIATGGDNGAGIGGGDNASGGTITVNGGDVEATGGSRSAGIGGGNAGAGGSICINGGSVEARGQDWAAGIGGGYCNPPGTIEISSGKVIAYGGSNGAGIGGSSYTNLGDVTIRGGLVEAYGGYSGAGIGAGCVYNGFSITIINGSIKAVGGPGGAGIGGGIQANDVTITIYDGTIDATGTENAAGIGSGQKGSSTINIHGGYIKARGATEAAGIGTGKNGTGGSVFIHGGEIDAQGGPMGAGIGGGSGTSGALEVTISGGTVKATGGPQAPGIGPGDFAKNYTLRVTITGGSVTAAATQASPGIGSSAQDSGTIVIEVAISGGTVTCTGVHGWHGIDVTTGDGCSFTTTVGEEPGTAIIYSTIGNTNNKEDWSAIIFNGNTGVVYGTPRLSADFELTSVQTLDAIKSTWTANGTELSNSGTLTIESGVTFTNNGKLTLKDGGAIINNGTIATKMGGTFTDPALVDSSSTGTITYETRFKTNGGTITKTGYIEESDYIMVYTYGTTTILPARRETKLTDHIFAGWYESNAYNGDAISEFSSTDYGCWTLYARWVDTFYKMILNANGGYGGLTARVCGLAGLPYGIVAPIKAGYTFGGYFDGTVQYYDANMTPQDDDYAFAADLTLTAKWSEATDTRYYVYHYQKGLTSSERVLVEIEAMTGTTGSQTAATANDYDGFDTPTVTQTTISADGSTIVEIEYERTTYSVVYETQGGGTAPTDSLTYAVGSTVNLYDGSSLTKTGYRFVGWNTNASETHGEKGAYVIQETDVVSDAIKFYAIWSRDEQYKVTYVGDAAGVTNLPVDSNTYAEGDVVNVDFATTPARTGYTFAGWATASGATSAAYTSDGTKTFSMEATDVTLYAVWEINTYTVTIQRSEAYSISDVDQECDYGKVITFSVNAIDGYSATDAMVFANGVFQVPTNGSSYEYTVTGNTLLLVTGAGSGGLVDYDVTVNGVTKEYDGEESVLTYAVYPSSDGKFKEEFVRWYKIENGTRTLVARGKTCPVKNVSDSGTYYVVVVGVDESETVQQMASAGTVTIDPAEATIKSNQVEDFVYDGTKLSELDFYTVYDVDGDTIDDATATLNGSVTYYGASTSADVTASDTLYVGTYAVTVACASTDGNYVSSPSEPVTFTVFPDMSYEVTDISTSTATLKWYYAGLKELGGEKVLHDCDDHTIDATLKGDDGRSVSVTVTPRGDGIYDLTYPTLQYGVNYTFEITVTKN